jgi:tRNA A-37 threonylcarbamoyl transferase component Bud32
MAMARTLGRYELLRPLARGGMAEVFLARRRAAGIEKWLVVKRMRPQMTGDPRFLDLFVREARLSMSLVHQNIVPVFDFGRVADQVFLAMERVEGKDLGSSLARGAAHPLPPLLAAFIAAECCQALDYAHRRRSPDGMALGIVHRDVTPRNVLLSWSGEVKLTDFGIAALAGDATSRLLGTPHYMAPEQARSEPTDPRADLYAVGLVLREAISGVRPRPGSDREAILDAARRGVLLPWPHLKAGAAVDAPGDLALGTGDHTDEPPRPPPPAGLFAIVERATALDPAERYPDARSMLEALDSFIVGERAANKGDAPARQLAAWLAAVWEGARDDLDADAAFDDDDDMVSFADDSALEGVGTGTERSMASTAAEADDLPPVGDAAAAAAVAKVVDVPALRAPEPGSARHGVVSSSQANLASGSFHALPGDSARPGEPARRGWMIIAGTAVIAATFAAAGAMFVVSNRGHDDPPPPRPDLGHLIVREPPPPAEPATSPPAQLPPAPTPAPVPPAPVHRAQITHPATGRPAPAPLPVAPAVPDAVAHKPGCKVRINLTPWAFYTADDDPARHETPSTVELAPGRHRLHVWNPELHVERDITINVPADRDAMNFSEPLSPSSSLEH